jgi:tetratricopeptide (TPR) repeat protein
MTTDSFNDRLSEYLDGELSAPERAAVDAHLAHCAGCRDTLEQLRSVMLEATSLGDRAPSRDLWTGVASRIAPGSQLRGFVSPFRRAISSRLSFTLPQLAAAGLALMVLSGGLVWMARSGDPRADFPPISAHVADGPAVSPATFADPTYDEAIADLERALEAGRTELDPETVRVVQENLGAIDRAIDESRRALTTDPANVYLNTHLAEMRQRKLMLLRRSTALQK